MKRLVRKKALGLLCLGTLVCASAGLLLGSSAPAPAPIKGEDKVVYQSALYNWRLVGTPYTIENYSSAVRVFDPNGNPVEISSEGKILLTVAGEYVVVYPSGTERLYSLLKKPITELQLSAELEESYPAGTVLALPALEAENEAYDFAYYYVEVILGDAHLETLKVDEGKSTVYLLEKDGEYEFKYYVLNDRGEKESVSLTTVAEKEKAILADELPAAVKVGEKISFGWPYAFYDETVYEVLLSVKKDGVETPITGQSFTPENTGEYTFTYKTEIGGETVTEEKTVTAYAPEETLFRLVGGEGETQSIQTLPSWNANADYEEGLLLKGSTESVKFDYTGIVDLSTLTKEDNLLVFLPYSDAEEDAYMEALRIVFTDVHDADKKLSLYFWADGKIMGNTNVPSTYATVEIGPGRYGIEHSDRFFGRLMNPTGAVADRSSFKGAHNDYSDVFSIQYDYLTEILYLTSNYSVKPRQQYVYLPLSGKGTLPSGVARLPERYWFDGFTTGEAYMSVELIGNKNAGVYLCEVAGKKASEWQADFEKNFLVFDEAIKELPTGAVGYEYTIPTAHLNENFEGEASVFVSVKDGEGNAVTLKDGKFTPTAAGRYTATYQASYFGTPLERVYEINIGEEPMDIGISVSVSSPTFGGYMDAPEIELTGGNGKTEYSYRVLLGETELTSERNGQYLIKEEGTLKIVVTAKDATGYQKTQEFDIAVQDGSYFVLAENLPTAIRIGWPTNVPAATAKCLVGGVYTQETVTVKAYENGVEQTIDDGRFTPSAAATKVSFEYSYAFGDETLTQTFECEVMPEEMLSVTEYLLTDGAVTKGITEKGILLTVTGNASVNMPHPVAAESLLLTVGFHKDSTSIDGWEIVLRDTELSAMALRLTLSDFNATAGTVSVRLNGSSAQTVTGRANTYTQSCGNEATVEKYAGKEYVLFSLILNSAKATLNDYETERTLFTLTAFENGTPFGGFAGNACMVETTVTKTSAGESDLLLCQVGNQYFNYGEDSFGYFDSDGIAPTIVINGDKTSKSVAYGYKLTVPSASAYDVLGGSFSVKVRIMANGEEVLSARDASKAFEFVLNEYKAYAIVYEANDFSGNRATAYFNLTVVDEEAPTLTVNGSYEAKIKMGTKVKIHSFTAADGQGGVETVVFVKDDQAKMTFVKAGDEYTFTKNGKYEIVYRSVDEAGNIVRKAFMVVVE